MYRFALRPLWILSHLFAVAVVVVFAALGFWQLDRHDERAARNATVAARSDLPPTDVRGALVEVGEPDELRFRTVSATGTFGARDLLVDNRSKDGLPGAWVLTSMELDDGTMLVVNRGFQFSQGGGVDPAPAPTGTVAVEGTVTAWEDSSCGVRTDDAGTPVGMACLRRSTAEEAFGSEVLPVVVQSQASAPPTSDLLVPVPAPELDAGPHRSYAFQWFAFAAIVGVVYPLILRRKARGVGEQVPAPVAGDQAVEAPVLR